MRQGTWEEMFRQQEAQNRPPPTPSIWSRISLFSWEELITLIIVLISFLTVVQSIDGADWVVEMPSLFPMALLGLITGLLLSRIKINELFIHLMAIPIGIVGVFWFATSKLPGSFTTRSNELIDRFGTWARALADGGISNDNLPFVVLVVGLTFVMAYLAAWSIFRWYNAWIALIPGGLALLTNISYLPGQHSLPLLIYLFGAILLVARMNVLRRERDWQRDRTNYPDLLSLHVLNVTIWVALGLLALAWLLPVGSGSGALYSLWRGVTAPVVNPLSDFGRVFAAIDAKKGGTVHRFGSTLPLQGEISLGGGEVMQVTASEPGFLRAQSYDFYTAQGWKIGPSAQITTSAWPALKALQSPDEARRALRRFVSIEVKTSKKTNVIFSEGDPLDINLDTRVVFGPDQADVTSVRPSAPIDAGKQYRVSSTISNASVDRLRTAPTILPAWAQTYLQLPSDLPQTVARKAQEVTASNANAYDKANAIEQYLRTFPVDTKIDPAPPKKDSVAYFLFDAQRGYFDYHASAMVVMLRSLGIPSRLTVGYVLHAGDRQPDTNTYVVSEANAFAWPEVYFPTLGWVEFNPTPSEPRITRTGSDDQQFSGTDDEPFLDEVPAPTDLTPSEPAAAVVDQIKVDEGPSLVSRIIVTIILALICVSLLTVGLFQYSLSRGLGGLPYPVQTWEKTLRLARWARIRPAPQETPREVTQRLHRALPEVADLNYLGESYIRARYGRKELAPAERDRLEDIWHKIRANLLGRILHWK